MVLLGWLKREWLRVAVHVGSVVPLAWLLWRIWQGLFLVDPIKQSEDATGKTAFILLILVLACTPASTVLGFKQAIRVRRTLGLYSFGYAALHFAIFLVFDYRLDLSQIVPALFTQRFVALGFVAGLILLALASTATKGWQKRLRMNWKRLHRLVYLAGVLVVFHYLFSIKDYRVPVRYGVVVALLLVLRIPFVRKAAARARYALVSRLKGRKKTAKEASDLTTETQRTQTSGE